MIWLPVWASCFCLVATCLAADADSTTAQCPGICQDGSRCITVLNETDCPADEVCCIDHLEKTTTEFEEATTQPSLGSTVSEQLFTTVEDSGSHTEQSTTYHYLTENEVDESDNEQYSYVLSDESEGADLHAEESSYHGVAACSGRCVNMHFTDECDYVAEADTDCDPGLVCCLTAEEVQISEDPELEGDDSSYEMHDGEESSFEDHYISRRSAETENCPGICVHPSHTMYCDQVLPQFPCPLNSKCCVKGVAERAIYGQPIIECKGQCLPSNMRGFCLPPNEIHYAKTDCAQGSYCCMTRRDFVQAQTVNLMRFPGIPPSGSNMYTASQVLGHLAVDDAGTVFRVSPDGQVFPLPKLPFIDPSFTRLAAYPRFDGEIVIFADGNGKLYQQFYPLNSQDRLRTPESQRQPIYQHYPQASEQAQKLNPDHKPSDVVEDLMIPDEDEIPKPAAPADSRPSCPGSCMSYFLRFTCFRGYAIYDGFSCPGRSVCCAKLKDIEDHEQYLKSQSPYYNGAHSSQESTLPRCGLKGRRDAPRVVGGRDSLPGEWCWQVAIINMQNQYICGGVLIDDSWVLTAAHCVVGSLKENLATFVRAGVTDLKSAEDNSRGQTVRVLSTFIHHNFNDMNLDNNIALLRLQKPFDLGARVCVVCLPTRGEMPPVNDECSVTGYGFVSPDEEMSLKIREAKVPIIEDMDCMANVSEALANPFILPSSSFCAGGQGQDSCQGDAGGPLTCEVGGFHEVIGLVSWGLGCGRLDVPSIYVKVPAFMGWINQIISSNSLLNSLD